MRPLSLAGSLLLCVLLAPLDAIAATISGRTYEEIEGTWFFVDGEGEEWEIAPGLMEIKFDEGVTEAQQDSIASEYALEPFGPEPSSFEGYFRFTYSPSADPVELLTDVAGCPLVDDAELAWKIKPLGDPYFSFDKQWNAFLIDLERALFVTSGESEVLLAIHDFGVDKSHEDLVATVWTNPNEQINGVDDDEDYLWTPDGSDIIDDLWGWDFDRWQDPIPLTAHGTLVAGMAVAANDNDVGIVSPAGGGASGRPIRWLAVIGTNNFTMRDAFLYCLHKGVNVINVSFTFSSSDARAVAGMEAFINSGGLVVAGSGNACEGTIGPVAFPAAHDSVLAVGAVDSLMVQWDYSCAGSSLDLVAPAGYALPGVAGKAYHWSTDNYCNDCPGYNPGACNCSTRVPDGRYTLAGGTSAAAPQVAGVAALVWSQRPELSAAQVRALLRRSARDLGAAGPDDFYGHGLIDAYRAVTRWGTLGQTNYWSGNIHISGDLTVTSGDSLVLAPGTAIHVARDDNEGAGTDTSRVEIVVYGTLLADSVTFLSFGDGSPSSSDWKGIRIASGGRAVLKHVQVDNAAVDLAIDEFNTTIADWDTTATLYLNSDFSITSDFTIAEEESLFVLGESVVTVTGGSNVDITVEGSLICKGSAAKKPEFRSSTGQANSWELITLAEGSENHVLHNVIFRHAKLPIRTFVPLTVDSCSFSDGIDGIQHYADLTVRNSSFSDLASTAVSLRHGDLVVENVEVSNCGNGIVQNPADSTSTGSVVCRDSRLRDLAYRGIDITYAVDSLSIVGTHIENAGDGIWLAFQDAASIDSCTIEKTDVGIFALDCDHLFIGHSRIDSSATTGVYLEYYTGGATLAADTVRYSPVGVFWNTGSSGTVASATRIVANDLGVKCDDESSIVIRNTLITGSTVGVAGLNDAMIDMGHATGGTGCDASGSDLGNNSIHTNSSHHAVNLSPSVVFPAEGNYWGPQGPKASKFSGAVDYDPYICSDPLPPSFTITLPPPEEEPGPRLPGRHELFASRPNPFNPTTTMRYDVPAPGGVVAIVIYDVTGARVRTLVSGRQAPGVYHATWDGRNDRGAPSASGVYFVRMTAGAFTQTRKVVLLK